MDCSTLGFPVCYHLQEIAQTHVHCVRDAIQPLHPLSSSSPPAFNLSQHWGFFLISWVFTSGGQSIGASASASVFPMNIQDWFPLGLTELISLQSKGLSRVFSNTTVQKNQFFSAQPEDSFYVIFHGILQISFISLLYSFLYCLNTCLNGIKKLSNFLKSDTWQRGVIILSTWKGQILLYIFINI